jgi:hypothetical protein
MAKINHVNSTHCKNATYILERDSKIIMQLSFSITNYQIDNNGMGTFYILFLSERTETFKAC